MIRWVGMFSLLGIFLLAFLVITEQGTSRPGKDLTNLRPIHVKQSNEAVHTLVQPEPLKLTVVLKKHYIDGVTETTRTEETIWSMMDFWSKYEGWTVQEQKLHKVVFSRKIKDISPLTKKQGYFGLNQDGELAVFQGIPGEGKVIESFKPIPLKPLESKRTDQLKDGIKIKNYRHFEQVVKQYTKQKEV